MNLADDPDLVTSNTRLPVEPVPLNGRLIRGHRSSLPRTDALPTMFIVGLFVAGAVVILISSYVRACLKARVWARNIDGPPASSRLFGEPLLVMDEHYMLSVCAGNLLDMIDPTSGEAWQLDAVARYGGIVKTQGLLKVPVLCAAPSRSHPCSISHPLFS
jgi:hypothetical protein